MVMLHHIAMGFYLREDDFYQQSSTLFGAFGVDVFFGLSGLLITKLLLEEARDSGRISLRSFYIRRAFRILPPYLLFLTALVVFGTLRTRLELESCLLFFRNYIPPAMGTGYTQHLWSLAVEEHFYLLWPGLLVLSGTKRGRMIAAWVAIGVGLWRVVNAQNNFLPKLLPHFRTDLRLDALLWGCVAAFLLDNAAEREAVYRRLNGWVWTIVLVAAACSIRFYSLLTGLWLAMLVPAAAYSAYRIAGDAGPGAAGGDGDSSPLDLEPDDGMETVTLDWQDLLQPVSLATGFPGAGLDPTAGLAALAVERVGSGGRGSAELLHPGAPVAPRGPAPCESGSVQHASGSFGLSSATIRGWDFARLGRRAGWHKRAPREKEVSGARAKANQGGRT